MVTGVDLHPNTQQKDRAKKKKKTAGARRQGIDVGSCVEENDVNETVAVGTLLI